MSTLPLPKVDNPNGMGNLAGLLSQLGPLFGTGKTTTTSGSEPVDTSNLDALMAKILGDVSPENLDAMVGNILERAKQTFGPAAIASNAAGGRAYSDTVLRQMRNEAMARATGEAAAARLQATNDANRTAAGLANAKIQAATASARKTTTSQVGASPAGKGGLMLSGASFLYNQMKKKGPLRDVGDVKNSLEGMLGMDKASIGSFDEAGFDGLYTQGSPEAASLGAESFTAGADSTVDLVFGGEDALPIMGGSAERIPTRESADIDPDGLGGGETFTAGAETGFIMTPDKVVTGVPMPPAIPVDPSTGLPIQSMPAPGMPPVSEEMLEGLDAVDALPADFGLDSGMSGITDFAADIGTDFGVEAGAEFGGEVAGELFGDIYFPGAFTIANALTGGELGEEVGSGLDAVSDMVSSGGPFGFISDFFGGEGPCFITTAATNNGELDNGFTLSVLREFRNKVMQETPEGQAELAEYYFIAPIVVHRINKSRDADRIWTKIREDFLVPAVVAYKTGLPEQTHEIYREMMYWARQQVGLANPHGSVQ
jgi:hypothetical protein